MTQAELIAEETERLLKKIAALEAKPLDFFGSQRNKILTIGYYKYRLEDLAKDPDKYFKEPARFEGNVKYSEVLWLEVKLQSSCPQQLHFYCSRSDHWISVWLPGHLPILALRESLNDMSGADKAYQLWAKKVDFRVKSF